MYLTAIHNRIRTAFETEYKLIFHSDDDVVNFVKQVCVLVKDNSSMRLRDFDKHKKWANIVRRECYYLRGLQREKCFYLYMYTTNSKTFCYLVDSSYLDKVS